MNSRQYKNRFRNIKKKPNCQKRTSCNNLNEEYKQSDLIEYKTNQ